MTVYSYQLTIGEHTVKYTLKDPTMIGAEVDEETGMPLKFNEEGMIFEDGKVVSNCNTSKFPSVSVGQWKTVSTSK